MKEKGARYKSEIEDRLKIAQQEVDASELKKVSTTDPESGFMMNKKEKIALAYNPQLTVDRNGFVLANEVCQDPFDTDQLQPQVLQTESNIGFLFAHTQWSFDAGYCESENIKILSDKTIDGYVYCQEEEEETPYDKKYFFYDAAKNEYLCPAKGRVIFVGKAYDKLKKKTARFYKGTQCAHCRVQKECTKSRTGVRRIKVFPYETERNAMLVKMDTAEAKAIYKVRQQTVEPVFGDIKGNKGMTEFLTRGIKSVRSELNLVCMARNIKRIWTILRDKSKGNNTRAVSKRRSKKDFVQSTVKAQFLVDGCR
jgi:hypothetical protein